MFHVVYIRINVYIVLWVNLQLYLALQDSIIILLILNASFKPNCIQDNSSICSVYCNAFIHFFGEEMGTRVA